MTGEPAGAVELLRGFDFSVEDVVLSPDGARFISVPVNADVTTSTKFQPAAALRKECSITSSRQIWELHRMVERWSSPTARWRRRLRFTAQMLTAVDSQQLPERTLT